MNMPGRGWKGQKHRFGFQNQEEDKEFWGGAVSYKYRIHDPRLGRFFSVDPLAPEYPWNSVYAFSENRVVDRVELEGLEAAFDRLSYHTYSSASSARDAIRDNHLVADFLYRIPEASLDGGVYALSSLRSAFVAGVTFGYGKMRYNSGYRTMVRLPAFKYTYKGGVEPERAHLGSVPFNDAMRMMGGVAEVVPLVPPSVEALTDLSKLKAGVPLPPGTVMAGFGGKTGKGDLETMMYLTNLPDDFANRIKSFDFQTERINTLKVKSSEAFENGVYQKNIYSITSDKKGEGGLTYLLSLEKYAKSIGAKEIEINGLNIHETRFFDEKIWNRSGYTYEDFNPGKYGAFSVRKRLD